MVRTQWILLGVLAGPFGFYVFSLFRFSEAWIAHAVAIGLVTMAIAVVIGVRQMSWGSRMRLAAFSDFMIETAITFFFCVAGSGVSLVSVAQQAKKTAARSPYCIQVANAHGDYKPAGAWLDFSGLTMWADGTGSLRMQHHAVLVAGNLSELQLYHWSYRKREFVRGVLNEKTDGTAVTCIPVKNSIDTLPKVFSRGAENLFIRFSQDEVYSIPAVYQPRWSSNTTKSLSLAVTPPEFTPLKATRDALPWAERDRNQLSIEKNPNWLLNLMNSTPRGRIVEQRIEFGLLKRLIVLEGNDGRKYESSDYRIYADEQNKNLNTTLISCSPGNDRFLPSCQHRFLNKGRHFYFVHRPDDVPQWREMQKKALNLIASFEVQGAGTSLGH